MDRGLPLTRRTLLAAGGAGAVMLTGAGALRGVLDSAPAKLGAGPAAPVRSMFTPHVGTSFGLRGDTGAGVRAKLVAVEDLRNGRTGSEDAFGLLFHATGDVRLEQTIAYLEHPVVRTVPLLVSPAGTGAAGQDYFVTVNRVPSMRL